MGPVNDRSPLDYERQPRRPKYPAFVKWSEIVLGAVFVAALLFFGLLYIWIRWS